MALPRSSSWTAAAAVGAPEPAAGNVSGVRYPALAELLRTKALAESSENAMSRTEPCTGAGNTTASVDVSITYALAPAPTMSQRPSGLMAATVGGAMMVALTGLGFAKFPSKTVIAAAGFPEIA